MSKTAIITGSAGGLGKGIAERLANDGFNIVLQDINEALLLETEKEFKEKGYQAVAFKSDLILTYLVHCLEFKQLLTNLLNKKVKVKLSTHVVLQDMNLMKYSALTQLQNTLYVPSLKQLLKN